MASRHTGSAERESAGLPREDDSGLGPGGAAERARCASASRDPTDSCDALSVGCCTSIDTVNDHAAVALRYVHCVLASWIKRSHCVLTPTASYTPVSTLCL